MNKLISTGEGGIVVTNNDKFYEQAVRYHNQGMFREKEGFLSDAEDEVLIGQNYRMSELTGAVALAQLLPKTYGYSLRPYALGKLMDMAAQCHIPIFFSYGEVLGYGMYDLCSTYPEVNFVVTETAYTLNCWLHPVLNCCDNLYVGTDNFVVHRGPKAFADRYSAKKLLLSTGSATVAVSLIALSKLIYEQKYLIAYGNIERLLSQVRLQRKKRKP